MYLIDCSPIVIDTNGKKSPFYPYTVTLKLEKTVKSSGKNSQKLSCTEMNGMMKMQNLVCIKFMFSKKVIKIDEIFTVDLKLTT